MSVSMLSEDNFKNTWHGSFHGVLDTEAPVNRYRVVDSTDQIFVWHRFYSFGPLVRVRCQIHNTFIKR